MTLRVRADEPQENIKERLLGTTLAWQIDAGETQLGEAACVALSADGAWLTKDEWMGIFWAGLLLVVTVSCLFAAFNSIISGKVLRIKRMRPPERLPKITKYQIFAQADDFIPFSMR
ncbi:MAG: hypothetical protein ACLUI3_06210 [Christensenellales bacterium]